jgi:hypothetical protein
VHQLLGIDIEKFPMVKQRDKDSCVLANAEAIVKFFEPQSQWNQGRLWEELRRKNLHEPSFDHVKAILECDEKLSLKYVFCVSYAEPMELPDTLRSWLKRKAPVAFSYPVETQEGAKVHCNTALREEGDVFDIFDPGCLVSPNDWSARIKRMTAAEVTRVAKNRRDLFTISLR